MIRRMLVSLPIFAIVIGHTLFTEVLASTTAVRCKHGFGFDGRPLVPNEHVAKEIYTAIAHDLLREKWHEEEPVLVRELQSIWVVYQHGTLDGYLEMEIDKCTAAIKLNSSGGYHHQR